MRQYTLRSLSRIARLFAADSYAVAFRLGGSECNRLHWCAITRPRRVGGAEADWRVAGDGRTHEASLRRAVAIDNAAAGARPATFYALVIHSRPRGRIVA